MFQRKKEQNKKKKKEERKKERMHGFLNALAVVYATFSSIMEERSGSDFKRGEDGSPRGSVLLGVLGVWRLLGVRVVGVARKSKIPFIAVSIVTFLVYTDHWQVPGGQSLRRKRALVTGGNSGTGLLSPWRWRSESHVISAAAALKSAKAAGNINGKIAPLPTRGKAVCLKGGRLDISSLDSISVRRESDGEYGSIDYLLNNASLLRRAKYPRWI